MAEKVASAEEIAHLLAAYYLKAESGGERQRIAELAGAVGKEIIGSESKFLERVISLCNEAVADAQHEKEDDKNREKTVYETCHCGYEASDEEDMLDHIAYETGRAR